MKTSVLLKWFGKWLGISTLIGISAGSLSAFFLTTLSFVTAYREAHSWLIWLLPLSGLAVGLLYQRWGQTVEGGANLILDEIHQPSQTVPLRMIPLVLLGTWITHLFGGSAGREGTAVQMGAAVADQLAAKLKLTRDERTTVLMAGMSAGFGSVFGVPFAGALFGIEVLAIGHIRFRRAFECTVASFVGHATVLAWGVHHTHYVAPFLPPIDIRVIGCVFTAGLLFGLLAYLFSTTAHFVSTLFKNLVPRLDVRLPLGGLLVIGGYFLLGTFRYAGLGIPVIEESLHHAVPVLDFAYKSIFTILTLGTGFKGGEVTPLLFIGATFGNALATILPIGLSVLSALGFVGVFAGAANTPLACTLMAMEIFGPGIGLLALLACHASWLVSGSHGIYKSQRIARDKPVFKLFKPKTPAT